MWLSGQHKRPAEQSEGQTGIVTMSGGETAVLMDSERRGLQVYSPAGYRWTPRVGQRVLVIQGRGEIPCVVGARQDGDVPAKVTVEARELSLRGTDLTAAAQGSAVLQGGRVSLNGEIYVNGEELEQYVARVAVRALGV